MKQIISKLIERGELILAARVKSAGSDIWPAAIRYMVRYVAKELKAGTPIFTHTVQDSQHDAIKVAIPNHNVASRRSYLKVKREMPELFPEFQFSYSLYLNGNEWTIKRKKHDAVSEAAMSKEQVQDWGNFVGDLVKKDNPKTKKEWTQFEENLVTSSSIDPYAAVLLVHTKSDTMSHHNLSHIERVSNAAIELKDTIKGLTKEGGQFTHHTIGRVLSNNGLKIRFIHPDALKNLHSNLLKIK